jgi:hypothetical protein
MSPLVQTLGSAVLGGAVALLGFVLLKGDAPASAGSDPFGPGTLVLSNAACPQGWAASGQTFLLTSPDYKLVEGQTTSESLVMTSKTAGWVDVSFNLCVKGTAP